MGEPMAKGLAVLFVCGLLVFLLGVIVRFSFVSSFKTRGASERLRTPDPRGIAEVCGVEPAQVLVDMYLRASFIESTEMYLFDPTTPGGPRWMVGRFSPLTATDVKERLAISRVPGIPIADDMDKGQYYVDHEGAVWLGSPNVDGGKVQVAASIAAFSGYAVTDE